MVVLVGQSLNQTDGDLQEACRLGFQNYLIIITWLVSCSDTQERKTARDLFVDLCSIRNMEGKKCLLDGEVKLNEERHVVLKEVFQKLPIKNSLQKIINLEK